eukprot:Skav210716  [mRNA]  locus=scaffold1582:507808:508323:+ [translate_table: standard]
MNECCRKSLPNPSAAVLPNAPGASVPSTSPVRLPPPPIAPADRKVNFNLGLQSQTTDPGQSANELFGRQTGRMLRGRAPTRAPLAPMAKSLGGATLPRTRGLSLERETNPGALGRPNNFLPNPAANIRAPSAERGGAGQFGRNIGGPDLSMRNALVMYASVIREYQVNHGK